MKHVRKFPAPQISEAVFRGRKSVYNFEVYPINVQFNEVSAVYIISKRKIDRQGKAHHFLVCIGQTDSLVAEIKKHKRGKCVKYLGADTVSVILEDDEKKRLELEEDLKAAHKIPCHHDSGDFISKEIEEKLAPKIKPEIKIKNAPVKRELRAKPAIKNAPDAAKTSKIEKPKSALAKAKTAQIVQTVVNLKTEKPARKTKVSAPIEVRKIDDQKTREKAQKTEVSKAKKLAPQIEKATSKAKVVTVVAKRTARSKAQPPAKMSAPKIVTSANKSKIKNKPLAKVEAKNSKPTAKAIEKPKPTKTKVTVKTSRTKLTPNAKKPKSKSAKSKNVQLPKTEAPKKVGGKNKVAQIVKPAPKVGKTKVAPKLKASRSALPPTKSKTLTAPPKPAKVKKVAANTKAKPTIKDTAKGKIDRLKTAPRKRLAF